jgi:hypothetical protein
MMPDNPVEMTIYKYPLSMAEVDYQEIKMPKGSKILSIQLQDGFPTLWAMVPVSFDSVKRGIRAYPTGHMTFLVDIGKPEPFICTLQISGFVFHFFDAGEME